MGIGSTKSSNVRQRVSRERWPAKSGRGEAQSLEASRAGEVSERTWRIASVSIFVVAAVLRMYQLSLVPLHHDEGVNGNFLVRLVREGVYHYDPANYHGPTLYYFAAIFPWILRFLFGSHAQDTYGLTTFAIRLVPALFGAATVGLVLTLRRNLGAIATLSAACLLAISPGAVYLSRYFIHETLFVFFTLGIVVAGLKYFEDSPPFYLILTAISTALLFATKETAIISAGVLVIALLLTHLYRRLSKRQANARNPIRKKKSRYDSGGGEYRRFVERVGGPTTLTVWIVVALAVFIAVNVLFYSSFFTNYPKGVSDALRTFQFWAKTGKEAHVHPSFMTYIWWLLRQESPLLVLGAIGAALAILQPTRSLALFSALWAFGLIAAYSLIAYKTPWLSLNFIVPLALISGTAIQWLYEELGKWELDKRARVLVVVAVLLVAIGPLPGAVRVFDQIVAADPAVGLFKPFAQAQLHWKTFIPGYQTIDLN
ncbi:MAG: TIGR03663 family protein, partial [Acidobacteriota bacterium]|nr:TIGR03663 family protein [Acidobacteriota bacterium]